VVAEPSQQPERQPAGDLPERVFPALGTGGPSTIDLLAAENPNYKTPARIQAGLYNPDPRLHGYDPA